MKLPIIHILEQELITYVLQHTMYYPATTLKPYSSNNTHHQRSKPGSPDPLARS